MKTCAITDFFEKQTADAMRDVLGRYGIQQAILFGSCARKTVSKHSDVDLLLIKTTREHFFDRCRGIFRELSLILPGRSVDALVYTPEELESMKTRSFITKILTEGWKIYEH